MIDYWNKAMGSTAGWNFGTPRSKGCHSMLLYVSEVTLRQPIVYRRGLGFHHMPCMRGTWLIVLGLCSEIPLCWLEQDHVPVLWFGLVDWRVVWLLGGEFPVNCCSCVVAPFGSFLYVGFELGCRFCISYCWGVFWGNGFAVDLKLYACVWEGGYDVSVFGV